MCVCVCVCVCMYHVPMYDGLCARACLCGCVPARLRMAVCVCTYACVRACVCVCMKDRERGEGGGGRHTQTDKLTEEKKYSRAGREVYRLRQDTKTLKKTSGQTQTARACPHTCMCAKIIIFTDQTANTNIASRLSCCRFPARTHSSLFELSA